MIVVTMLCGWGVAWEGGNRDKKRLGVFFLVELDAGPFTRLIGEIEVSPYAECYPGAPIYRITQKSVSCIFP
jgi:hypothetical protein